MLAVGLSVIFCVGFVICLNGVMQRWTQRSSWVPSNLGYSMTLWERSVRDTETPPANFLLESLSREVTGKLQGSMDEKHEEQLRCLVPCCARPLWKRWYGLTVGRGDLGGPFQP